MPCSDGVEEIHEALATPSEITSCGSYQKPPMIITAYHTIGSNPHRNESSKKYEV